MDGMADFCIIYLHIHMHMYEVCIYKIVPSNQKGGGMVTSPSRAAHVVGSFVCGTLLVRVASLLFSSSSVCTCVRVCVFVHVCVCDR